jgi:hypothetical protein
VYETQVNRFEKQEVTMPNAFVPATAGGMPKFSRLQIMRDAWTIYRQMTRNARPSNVAGRRRWFANALRGTWETAKQAAADAIKTASQRAADRVEQIKAQMHNLDMRTFRLSITEERNALVSELALLRGENA